MSRTAHARRRPASKTCQLHNRRFCGQCFGVAVHRRVHGGDDKCPHDGNPHDACPLHSKKCLGCDALTTAYESCAPGYCRKCAGCVPSDRRTGVVIYDERAEVLP